MSNFPHEAVQAIYDTLKKGEAKYESGYWRGRPASEHMDHTLKHIWKWVDRIDDEEDHLAHALTRLAMAWCVREKEREQ